MGRQTQRKQEKEQQKLVKYFNILKTKRFASKTKDKNEIKESVLTWFESFRGRFISKEIRSIDKFFPLSFNKDLLKKILIKHMYVKYNVPDFILSEFINAIDKQAHSNLIFKWFFDITTGKSFYKENKQYFTKKEAHLFTNATAIDNLNGVIIWVKCKSREITKDIYTKIKTKTIIGNLQRAQWNDFLDFVARNMNRKIDIDCMHQMIDYVNTHPELKFKGRTWASVKRLSERWHKFSHWAVYAEPYMEWNNSPNFNWGYTDKYGTKWKITELNNSKELLEESIAMNHCVVTYKSSCSVGSCRIFSLTKSENLTGCRSENKRCLTIELKYKQTYQIRGNHNRKPTIEEDKIVKMWELNYLPSKY